MSSNRAEYERLVTKRDPKIGGRLGEKSFVVLALLVFAGAVWPLLAGERKPDDLLLPVKSVPELRLITYPIYTIIVCLAIVHARRIIPLLRANWIILFLVVLAFASSVWSVDTALTFRRSTVLAVTTAFGFYLVSRFALSEILRLVALSFSIAGVLSLLLVLADPKLAVMTDARGDALRGVFVHKNILGEFMLFGGAAALILAASGTRGRAIYLFAYLSAMALILASNSATYLVIGLLLLPVVVIMVLRRRMPRPLSVAAEILAFTIILLLAIVVASDPDTALGLLGRERTITGRTYVWPFVWEYIGKGFWVGYGYGAFWDGWMAPGYDIRALIGPFAHAHNGWLDVWLDLGAIGVALMAISFLGALYRAVKNVGRGDLLTTMVPMVFLVALLLLNFVEIGLLIQGSTSWVLYVVASVSANRAVVLYSNRRVSKSSARSSPLESYEPLPTPIAAPFKGRL